MQAGDGIQNVLGEDGEQGRIGIGGEGVAATTALIGEDDVRARRRAPLRRRGRTEQHDRRPPVCRGQMSGAGVGGDDQASCGDERDELGELGAAGQHHSLLDPGDPCDVHGAFPLGVAAGEHHPVAVIGQRAGHRGEARHRPAPRTIRRTDVEHGGAGDDRRRGRRAQPQVERIRRHAEGAHQSRPALPLVQVVTPARQRGGVGAVAIDLGNVVGDRHPRGERIDEIAAARTGAVQIGGDVDTPGGKGQVRVQSRHRQQLVDAPDELDHRREPAARGKDHPVSRERTAQSADGGDRDQQVTELQRPQDEHRGSHADTLPREHALVQGRLRGVPMGERVGAGAHRRLAAVLFDRDGTLVQDVPYNGDPDRVTLMPTAERAVQRLRRAGVRVGMISNQSGIGRGILTHAQVGAVNRRLEERLGPFDVCLYCPHTPEAGCDCRKPAPGLVLIACEILRSDPAEVVVIGDTEADVRAGEAAGGRGVLVPNAQTLAEEVSRAAAVAFDLLGAVEKALGRTVEPAEAIS